MLETLIFSEIEKNSKKFCFMNVIIGYISIVLYSDSSWSDTAISPEASFHMTPGKVIRTSTMYKIVLYFFERRTPFQILTYYTLLSKLNILYENFTKFDTETSSPVTWVISKKIFEFWIDFLSLKFETWSIAFLTRSF